MVCTKCEKKLAKLGAPDTWKEGSRAKVEDGSRKLGENKLLSGKKNKFKPYMKFRKCKVCKSDVHQSHAHYCQGCAYKIGICAMCGKQVQDTKNLKQSMT
eukprot:m.302665 g.302665  ORF g.302665 m.302665 type:complete len:100 (+) comp19581_c0_seq1:1599-1898(+)